MSSTKVLIWNSPGDRYYFDISTPELMENAALKIFEIQLNEEWINLPKSLESDSHHQELQQKLTSLMMLFEGTNADIFEAQHTRIETLQLSLTRREKRYRESMRKFGEIKRIVETQDRSSAKDLLENIIENEWAFTIIEAERVGEYSHADT